jgi:uncharacterized membrane protein
MKSQILNFISEIRSSYWYTPLMMLVMAVLLATLTISLDEMHLFEQFGKIGWLIGGNPDGARSFLSTIATAMITIASVTFSMTLIAVTFAGSQIGPRLTTNFMRDKTNQVTLGFFISAFLYCLLILRSIVQHNTQDMIVSHHELLYMPQISLLIALFLAVIGLIVLVCYIHHVPNSINMFNVVSLVGTSLFNQVETRFPCNIGEGAESAEINIPPDYHQHLKTVLSNSFGYIRILDSNALIELAKEHDCVLQLESDIGAFITINTPLLLIYSSKPVPDELIKQCQNAYALGNKRNQEQDLDFLVNELIEIIARALSPGVNDPFTAINAFDWLHLFLNKIGECSQPSRARKDIEGQIRLLTPFKDIAYYAEMIFTTTRPYVCKDYITTKHALNILQQLSIQAKEENAMIFDGHAQALIHDAKIAMKNMSFVEFL